MGLKCFKLERPKSFIARYRHTTTRAMFNILCCQAFNILAWGLRLSCPWLLSSALFFRPSNTGTSSKRVFAGNLSPAANLSWDIGLAADWDRRGVGNWQVRKAGILCFSPCLCPVVGSQSFLLLGTATREKRNQTYGPICECLAKQSPFVSNLKVFPCGSC